MEQRAAFPTEPNGNDPLDNPPGTVGEDTYNPGDPNGVTIVEEGAAAPFGATLFEASPWSGWPAEWAPPFMNGAVSRLTDTAWFCLDLNSSNLSTMPPYLVGAAPSLNADWLTNPDPDLYTGWTEFARQMFWDFQFCGEAFVLATARYATGWPARFHCVPPWMVESEIDNSGLRRHSIGQVDVTADVLHIRYTSTVGDARGHGPLEVAGPRLVAAAALARYARSVASSGGIPHSILKTNRALTATQAAALQTQWVAARMGTMGLPAVLSGDVTFETIQMDAQQMALVELSQWNEARIAVLLRVPPNMAALPTGGDSMTYSTQVGYFDYHWRAGLRPMAATVMEALSGWALPRGTTVELNRDEYVRPTPLERAQTAEILIRNGVITAEEERIRERIAPALGVSPLEPEGIMQ